jgi:hypothetical protein
MGRNSSNFLLKPTAQTTTTTPGLVMLATDSIRSSIAADLRHKAPGEAGEEGVR